MYSTWRILGPCLSKLTNLRLMCVCVSNWTNRGLICIELDKSWTYVFRTWPILDLFVSNLTNLGVENNIIVNIFLPQSLRVRIAAMARPLSVLGRTNIGDWHLVQFLVYWLCTTIVNLTGLRSPIPRVVFKDFVVCVCVWRRGNDSLSRHRMVVLS